TTSTTTSSTSTTTSIIYSAYDCYYTYNYQANLDLQNMQNTQIPFNEIIQNQQSSGEGQTSTNIFYASVLPYFQFNYLLPSPGGEQLWNSYDIFSPWNYYTPSNTEEPFPIDTPSRFYINYNGILVSSPSNVISFPKGLQQAMSSIAGNINKLLSKANKGNSVQALNNVLSMLGMKSPYVANPISIAAIPNDYVFVLNQSSNNQYYLTVLRLIPKGYYNMSNYPPSYSNIPNQTDQQEWNNEWNAYWANVIEAQNTSTYVVASYDISSIASRILSSRSTPFTPFNVTADDKGDAFITGEINGSHPFILGLITTPTGIEVVNTTESWAVSTQVPVLPEIAAPPTGDMLFAATPKKGYIYEFTVGNFINFTGNMSLSFGTSMPSLGQQVLVNITDYLYNGGLYGVKFNGVAAPNVIASAHGGQFDPQTDFDKAAFHHPLGLEDINGYLYVLDDWAGSLGTYDCGLFGVNWNLDGWVVGRCPVANYNILLLRVINSTGYSVPINPTMFNDVWQEEQCTTVNSITQETVDISNIYTSSSSTPPAGVSCVPSDECHFVSTEANGEYLWSCVANTQTKSSTYYSLSSTATSNYTYPPYGWPLSANITIKGNTVTFCSSSSCNYWPNNLPSNYHGGYSPIGPEISSSFVAPQLGFSVNYNSTVDLIMKKTPIPQSTWDQIKNALCTIGSWLGLTSCSTPNSPQYDELVLNARVNVQNYTKLFQGQPPYYCYVDSSKYSSNNNNGVCSELDQLKYMLPPVYTVSNPFRYVENTGTTQLITLPGFLNSFQSSPSMGPAYYKKGPPSLSIQYTNVPYGETDQIFSTASSSSDQVELLIGGNVVASGTGSVVYTICSSPSTCIAPGTTSVEAKDTTTGQHTKTSITVNTNPVIMPSMTSVSVQQQQGNKICISASPVITANTPYQPSSITLEINGVPGASNTANPGPVSLDITDYCSELQPGTTYTVVASSSSGSSTGYVEVSGQATGMPMISTNLKTWINGELLVPYSYTYSFAQNWGPAVFEYAEAQNAITGQWVTLDECNPPSYLSPPYTQPQTPSPQYSEQKIYTFALTNANSNNFETVLENAGTYLNDIYTQKLYVPNLTSTIVPPYVFYEIENNRMFGYVRANITNCNRISSAFEDCSQNKQTVLNSLQTQQYQIVQYYYEKPSQEATAKLFNQYQIVMPAYQTIETSGVYNLMPNAKAPLKYNYLQEFGEVPLFDFYQQVSSISNLTLNLNNYLGFHLINLLFNDRFNNTIYTPMAIDLANPVVITLSTNPQVSSTNFNQTVIQITGSAYVPPFGIAGGQSQPLANQPIYLYYDRDINFVGYNAIINPVNAILCAYAYNAPQIGTIAMPSQQPGCELSNPEWFGLTANANTITYAPSFNALGECNPPPNSMYAQNYKACNIYNNPNCGYTPLGNRMYCVPIYPNGTGVCTSQLGLFAIATTNANGDFSANVVACGGGSALGNAQIIAVYYGTPMEPLQAKVLPLPLQANTVNLARPYPSALTVNELNYYYAPNTSYAAVQIGEYYLTFGDVSGILGAGIVAAVLAYFLYRKREKGNAPTGI
ncbi:MAG: hypothetical protein ACP5IK_02655, partial [Candidatus Micrarchaeia archaeon]